jgi:hypothetical protein
VNRDHPTTDRPAPPPGPGLPAIMYVLAGFILVCLPGLLVWLAATAALRRTRARLWHLTVAAAVLAAGVVALQGGPEQALAGHFWLWRHWMEAPAPTGDPFRLAVLRQLAWAGLAHQLPLAVPAGLAAAVCHTAVGQGSDLARPEFAAAERRRHGKELARTTRRAARLADAPEERRRVPALAVSLGGDLDTWRHGRLIVPPPIVLGRPRALVGMPGFGKSVCLERECYLAAHASRRIAVLDGKGTDPDFAVGIVAAVLWANPDARVGLYPETPMDVWRGSAKAVANRLLACWDFSAEAEFYAQVAAVALRLALEAPGPAVRSSWELLARLQPGALQRLWRGHPDELALIKELDQRLGDVSLRLSNLLAALGGSFDGGWSFEDVDCAVVTVPSLAAPSDADAAMRILLADYAHFAVARKHHSDRDLLVFDEFSALEGGRRAAINLVERVRGSGSGVILAGQSRRSLGTEEEASRILHACSGGVALFRTPEPEDMLRLAGTTRQVDYAWQLQEGEVTDRATATMRARSRIEADQVRHARPGEAWLIEGGRAEHVQIIRNQAPAEVVERARLLVDLARGASPDADGRTDWRALTVDPSAVALEDAGRTLAGYRRPALPPPGGDLA